MNNLWVCEVNYNSWSTDTSSRKQTLGLLKQSVNVDKFKSKETESGWVFLINC